MKSVAQSHVSWLKLDEAIKGSAIYKLLRMSSKQASAAQSTPVLLRQAEPVQGTVNQSTDMGSELSRGSMVARRSGG